ncbi:MAG TPA: hypothetical protein VGQ57_08485 [Polyangiaceae bacterium]|jgi:hypothetical protein|nr:hypothetical protein [Polyangiaceae bacterium]
MFTFRRALALLLPLTAIPAALGCSPTTKGDHGIGGDSSTGAGPSMNGGGGNGTGGGGGSIVLSGGSGGTGGALTTSGGTGATGGSGTDTCADMITPGMAVPVDVYVMLDISYSMIDPNPAKWTAIKDALTAFLGDASSAGLNVAIQYFPLRVPNVPASCTTDAECGTAGPCAMNVCSQSSSFFITCTPSATDPDTDMTACTSPVQRDDGPCTAGACNLSGKACAADADCQTLQTGTFGRCVPLGGCEADALLSCPVVSTTVKTAGCGANGMPGLCVPVSASFCAHDAQCDPAAYAMPAVDYVTLPDSAGALGASIAAQMPIGDTPTRPALLGAIRHARAHAQTTAGHSQVIVLATDGFPTDCTGGREVSGLEYPPALDDVVSVATEGLMPQNPADASVSTFVIGVFDDTETTAQVKLDRVAKAGGSNAAFVISSGGDVQQKFLDALAQIRRSRLGCEFQIPPAPSGQKLDYNFVNVKVKHTDGSADNELFYVSPTGCTGQPDEWHYDCDLAAGPTACKPTKIIACPTTCQALGAQTNASGVNVGLGCKLNIR